MREPPPYVDEQELLDLIRAEWDGHVDHLDHLPVGFGAHHWAESPLEFVLACKPARAGSYTIPFGCSAVSVTPWTSGVSGEHGAPRPTRA